MASADAPPSAPQTLEISGGSAIDAVEHGGHEYRDAGMLEVAAGGRQGLLQGAGVGGDERRAVADPGDDWTYMNRSKYTETFIAANLAIGLKHAIYDAGYSCKRVDNAGFVGEYKNLDMWTAHCAYDNKSSRDWAIFAGPDGSAQVRDCKDVAQFGMPACVIKKT